jgi:hypothetical protein
LPPIHQFLEIDAARLSLVLHLAVTSTAAGEEKKRGLATSGKRRRFGDFRFRLGLHLSKHTTQ